MSDELPNVTEAAPTSETVADNPAPAESTTAQDYANADPITKSVAAAYDKAQARASNGQFTRLPNEPAIRGGEPQPDNPETTTPQIEGEQPPAENPEQLGKPQAWGKAIEAHWQNLPHEVKNEILRREDDVNRFITEKAEILKQADAYTAELNNVMQHFAHVVPRLPDGQATPPQALLAESPHLAALLQGTPEQRAGIVRHLAQRAGVDLAELTRQPIDPIESARQQERENIQRALNEQYAQQQQAQRAAYEQQQAQREQALINFVEQFAADKPNWSALEDEIHYHAVALRNLNPNLPPDKVLEQAYAKALAAHPEHDEQTTKTKLAEAKKKADEAKRIASINIGRAKLGTPPSSAKTFEETMREVADRMMP